MITATIVLMTIVALAVAVYPLLRRPQEPAVLQEDTALESLLSQREAVYAAIKDLEFDHAMGKLSEADYKALRGKYEGRAVAILRELDEASIGQRDLEEEIERRVRELRRARGEGAWRCPTCGASTGGSDRFCRACGATLGLTCPGCGESYDQGDRFCARCGQVLV